MLKHYLFWLLLFAFGRTVFLVWNREELAGIPVAEVFKVYVKAWYVDTAMACYLLILPFVFYLLSSVSAKTIFIRISNVVHFILFIAFFLIVFGELPIYDEWHTKLNYKALWFFGNPMEVIHTASVTQLVSCLAATAVCVTGAWWIYKRKIALQLSGITRSWPFILTFGLAVPALLFTGMRGGFYTIPVQLSDAYFSKYNVLNLASLNSPFNLASSCIENFKAKEPYHFLDPAIAQQQFDELQATDSDSTLHILTTAQPNIVLVVFEGWSADMVASLHGINEVNIAPNFDTLVRNGYTFSDCYASGALSDQGMAAVFSAYPAQPLTSIITQPNKYVHLPCINKKLKAQGYHTSFMFGGQLSYGNIRSYIYFNEFDDVIEGEDFPADIPQGKLGAHDQFLFQQQLIHLNKEQQPFFAAMFTLSTHGPYDFPSNTEMNYGGKEQDYVNSVHYADSCVGEFIRNARKQPWYSNTLFVFVSDHSHNSPLNYLFTSPPYRRIPLLFYGDVISPQYRGIQDSVTASQTDLAATLLGQLGIDYSDFRFSRNLFNPSSRRFAYYSFEEGFGFIDDNSWLTWSVDGRATFTRRKPVTNDNKRSQDSLLLLKKGQSILQTLTNDYWQE